MPASGGGGFCIGARSRTGVLPYIFLIPVCGYLLPGKSSPESPSLERGQKNMAETRSFAPSETEKNQKFLNLTEGGTNDIARCPIIQDLVVVITVATEAVVAVDTGPVFLLLSRSKGPGNTGRSSDFNCSIDLSR